MLAAVLLACLGAPSRGEAADFSWRRRLSSHFAVHHQAGMLPAGFVPDLESMHTRLRRDLAAFSPWMARERINLYLYEDQRSYVGGEFHPPEWSQGIAVHEKKAVVVYAQPDRAAMMETISHEITHLLFEGYWADPVKVAPQWSDRQPPRWLDEGLAMLEECDTSQHPERCPRYQAMAYFSRQEVVPLERFFVSVPDQQTAQAWYTQAYSLAHFLCRQRSRLEFKKFVSELRSGRDVGTSLWMAYRYMNLAKFEKAWLAWLLDPKHRSLVDNLGDLSTREQRFDFKPIQGFNRFK